MPAELAAGTGPAFTTPVCFMPKISAFILLALLCCLLPASSQAVSLQGPWNGTRTQTPPGSLPASSNQTLTLYQASPGGAVVGMLSTYWPGTAYYWAASASGTISGSTLTLTWSITPGTVNLPSGTMACGETLNLPLTTSGGVTTPPFPATIPAALAPSSTPTR